MIGAGIEPASELLPVLLAAVESIYQHAYDEHTPIDDIKADFDKMRSLASEAINKATKESIVTTATAWNGRCHRCGKETTGHIMSMFNHDLVCFDCKDEEVKRDDYAKAEAAEGDAVRKGNYNYGGIGLHGSGEEAP
jgi:lysyl-tRNA synthetase class I